LVYYTEFQDHARTVMIIGSVYGFMLFAAGLFLSRKWLSSFLSNVEVVHWNSLRDLDGLVPGITDQTREPERTSVPQTTSPRKTDPVSLEVSSVAAKPRSHTRIVQRNPESPEVAVRPRVAIPMTLFGKAGLQLQSASMKESLPGPRRINS
jgi:hypothetical protein